MYSAAASCVPNGPVTTSVWSCRSDTVRTRRQSPTASIIAPCSHSSRESRSWRFLAMRASMRPVSASRKSAIARCCLGAGVRSEKVPRRSQDVRGIFVPSDVATAQSMTGPDNMQYASHFELTSCCGRRHSSSVDAYAVACARSTFPRYGLSLPNSTSPGSTSATPASGGSRGSFQESPITLPVPLSTTSSVKTGAGADRRRSTDSTARRFNGTVLTRSPRGGGLGSRLRAA